MREAFLLWCLLGLAAALPHLASAMYCGDKNCYEIIGAKPTATEQEIKRIYRKASLQYHPDKNPDDPDAKQKFQELARAYEIITNERLRRAYDYYLDNPDDKYTNEWRYYEAQFSSRMAQADLRAVIIGAIFIISVIQYASKHTLHTRAMEGIRKTPRYKNLLKRLQMEAEAEAATQAAAGKGDKGQARQRKAAKGVKKTAKLSAEELKALEDQADAEVVMHGGFSKPVWHEIFAVQIFVFPIKAVQYFAWQGHWLLDYGIRGRPYNREDQAYLTCHALSIGRGIWDNLPLASQDELLLLKLWTPGATEDEKLMRRVRDIHRNAAYRADLGKGGASPSPPSAADAVTAQLSEWLSWEGLARVQGLLKSKAGFLLASPTPDDNNNHNGGNPDQHPVVEGAAECDVQLVSDGEPGKKQ